MSFASELKQERKGLLVNGTFVPVSKDEVLKGMPIVISRFIDDLKMGKQARMRNESCLVAQNYNETGAEYI